MKAVFVFVVAGCLAFVSGFPGERPAGASHLLSIASPQAGGPAGEELQRARDHADIGFLRNAIATARQHVSPNNFDATLRLAYLEDLLFEAGSDHQDRNTEKLAAQEGVNWSEKAAQLNPNSSEAHRLLAQSLARMIPFAFAGGMRFGPRSTREAERAMQLDPKNAEACIVRASAYFYTPETFGGNKRKAVALLKHALEIDPTSDDAHIALAQMDLASGMKDEARKEISEALRLNPRRAFAQSISSQIAGGR